MDSPNYIYLKDICTVNQGLQMPISKRHKDNGINRYFYITIQFLKDNVEDRTYIENPPEATICRKNDILVTRTGSTGKIVTNIEGCFHNNFFKVNYNKEKIDSRYLYYCLTSKEKQREMKLRSGITTIPDLNHFMFLDMKIPYFNIARQKKISKVLDAINNKIELNNQINQKLEAMAKTLYDYWFVQFDFPDANGKPYKSSGGKMVYSEALKREIPEGWEVKKISDLLPVITGKEDANFAVKDGEYPFFTCSDKVIACDTYAFDGKAILVAGNGNFDVKLYEGKFNAYQRTYVLITDDEKYYALLYFVVKDQISMLTNSSRGSIIKFITKGDLENIPLVLPKQNQDKIFNQLNTIVEKIEKSREETQKLTQLRDWLLPMLMNGQVTVADAKEQIDELMVAEPSVGYGEKE